MHFAGFCRICKLNVEYTLKELDCNARAITSRHFRSQHTDPFLLSSTVPVAEFARINLLRGVVVVHS